MTLQIINIKNNPVDSNCFLLFDKTINNKCLIIDPGCKVPSLLEEHLTAGELTPEFIVLTHEHFDHIWGCNYLYEKFHIITLGSALCAENIKSPKYNCSRYYEYPGFETHINIKIIEDNSTLYWNSYKITFFITKGHSDASICFTIGHLLFTGDTLIENLRTVTNILSGSPLKLESSRLLLESLKGNGYTVCPGHGECFQLDEYELRQMIK